MRLGLVPGGKVFSYVEKPEELYVKVHDINIYLHTPPSDPACTELAIKLGGDGSLFRCTHDMDVNIHPIGDLASAT